MSRCAARKTGALAQALNQQLLDGIKHVELRWEVDSEDQVRDWEQGLLAKQSNVARSFAQNRGRLRS